MRKYCVVPTLFVLLFWLTNLSCDSLQPAEESNLYEHPETMEIAGYSGDAMEPCISLDGRYLFFNNNNDEKVQTHIHCAKRVSENSFKYLGILRGTQSQKKDMAPSLDCSNRLYFTSLRSFDADHKSLYAGVWHPDEVTNVSAIGGNISPTAPFWINMDSCISPDGNTLLISRAQFIPFSNGPRQSDLFIAIRQANGEFQMSQSLQNVLNSVNTSALEYAPAITADQLELYFTRCREVVSSSGKKEPLFETMVARRKSVNEPFDLPKRLSAIEGFAEAPSLTLDKRELFFHKRIGEVFKICRITRSADTQVPGAYVGGDKASDGLR